MTIDIEVAERFGALVAEGNYGGAYGYLTQAAEWENPPMVYTSFIGAGDCEAVTVVLTSEDGVVRIRSLEWGRP
ncbi:MAG: hypothetical protein GC158_05435 [Cyanobacteria bacterium RI_101]|nr:hypothetical protein [Cyanobacteria bacterium RI_101]